MPESRLPESPWPTAAVVYANQFQFGRGDRIAYPRVLSRMLLWCKAGVGAVQVNGERFALLPDQFLVLPWGHAITYEADAEDPFLVGGIHLIPDLEPGHPLHLHVAHFPEDALAAEDWRRDAPLPGLDGVRGGAMRWGGALEHLADYILHRFLRGDPEEWECRHLAGLLIQELLAALETQGHERRTPPELHKMLQYIDNHLDAPLSMSDLSAFSGKSPSTISRLFRRCLGCTANEYVQQRRIEEACRLLRTTRRQVGDIGAAVGVPDPYYFSKLFKKVTGLPPMSYRKQAGLL